MDVLTPELRPTPERSRHGHLKHEDEELSSKHSHHHRHHHRNRSGAGEDESLHRSSGVKHSREGKSSSKHKHKRHKHKHRRKHMKDHDDGSGEDEGNRKEDSGRCTVKDDASMDDVELQDGNLSKKSDFAGDGIMEGERRGVEDISKDISKRRDVKRSMSHSLVMATSVQSADDEKEEGEILEEEEVPHRCVQSDAESGEIQTDLLILQTGEMSWEGHLREEEKQFSGGIGQSQRDGKALDPGDLDSKGTIRSGASASESMAVIAETYDSDLASEDHSVDEERRVEDSLKRKLKKRPSKSPETQSNKRQNCRSSFRERDVHAKEVILNVTSHESGKEDQLTRRSQSPSQGSENEEGRGKQNVPAQTNESLSDQNLPQYSESGVKDHQGDHKKNDAKSRTKQKSNDAKSRDTEMISTDHNRRSGSIDNINENKERVERSESKEHAHRYRYDSRGSLVDSRRRSRSRENDRDSHHGKDSPSRSSRYRRSRSREAGRNYRERLERSKEEIYDSKSKNNYGKSERSRRSRSRDSERQSKYIKDRNDHRRRSISRETTHDSRHPARGARETTERSKRSRSRDVLHDSGLVSRARDAPYESREWDQQEQRHSRPREENQSRSSGREYAERRRSTSRGRRDSLERRRRSRSRTGTRDHGECLDRRRRSRSRENMRSGRTAEYYHHRNARGEERDRVTEGLRGSGRERSDVTNVKDVDFDSREEEDEEENPDSGKLLSEDEDVERIKEESRKRRQAILEKYKVQNQSKNELKEPEGHDLVFTGRRDTLPVESDSVGDVKAVDENASVVSDDLKKPSFDLGKGPMQIDTLDRTSGARGLGEGTPKSDNDKSNDMFCDYIFGESPAGGRKLVKGDGVALETSGLTDNWDDPDGYYCYRIGEVLDGRYEVAASHGRGVFSSVVRARDMKASGKEHDEVAIKIIRNNDVMFKSGQQELVILKKLAGADPDNKRHCVLFLTSFEYRNHLCLVFESLHMNLREILKKFGRNIGINLTAVRAYAKQLFIALKHLRNCGVLHCDIKPDNMLVNEAKNALKLCDFGSAMFAGENEITPYLVSRFYRAPEIILGLPYDHPLDIWSVGCCLYEFFTGKVLFPGPTNNDMLKLHMELKGPFPKKMLKKAGFASKHFDQDYNFCAVEEDPVTRTNIKRVLVNIKPRDIGSLLSGHATADEDPKMLSNFKDLLEKIFMLDPEKRLTVSQALNHPFITGK